MLWIGATQLRPASLPASGQQHVIEQSRWDKERKRERESGVSVCLCAESACCFWLFFCAGGWRGTFQKRQRHTGAMSFVVFVVVFVVVVVVLIAGVGAVGGDDNCGHADARVRDLAPGWNNTQCSFAGTIPLKHRGESWLFYTFFTAQNGNASAPVILWLNGGPGLLCSRHPPVLAAQL